MSSSVRIKSADELIGARSCGRAALGVLDDDDAGASEPEEDDDAESCDEDEAVGRSGVRSWSVIAAPNTAPPPEAGLCVRQQKSGGDSDLEWGAAAERRAENFACTDGSHASFITTHNIWVYVRFITVMHKPHLPLLSLLSERLSEPVVPPLGLARERRFKRLQHRLADRVIWRMRQVVRQTCAKHREQNGPSGKNGLAWTRRAQRTSTLLETFRTARDRTLELAAGRFRVLLEALRRAFFARLGVELDRDGKVTVRGGVLKVEP